jgi:[acyl-carrier-protein] S-malonyltransferase
MKVAMLFPGQGSQYVGMGKALCEQFDIARNTFQQANEALNYDIQKLCFEGSMEELTKTENSQPAILTASVAAFRVYMQELGVAPHILAGHSLGEYSALVCTGGIEFADALKTVRQRGLFMQAAVPVGVGSMAAVNGLDIEVIERECSKYSTSGDKIASVSNYNSKDQIVISGHKEAISELSVVFSGMGANVIPLNVSAPFHCALMQPAADNLKLELQKYTYKDFKYPVISNVYAVPYATKDEIVDTLTKQVVDTVRWHESMKYLAGLDIDFAIEMGPKNVLKNLMRKNVKDIVAYTYDREEDIKTIKSRLTITQNNGNGDDKFMTVITRCMAAAVCTKNSNWNNDEYTNGVIEPYRRIKQIQMSLEKEGIKPTKEQAEEALSMLKSVFRTKGISTEGQLGRFNQILNETNTRDLFESIINI